MSAVSTQARPAAPAARLRIKPPRIREAAPERRRALGSVSFVLLIFSLLAGGLVSLLIVNNTLAAGSFEQARLRADLTLLGEQEQALTREVERASSPTQLRAAAKLLGMVPSATTTYVDPATGAILGTPIASGTTTGLGAPVTPKPANPATTGPTPATADGATDPDTASDSATTDAAQPPSQPAGDGASTDPATTAYDEAVASGGTP